MDIPFRYKMIGPEGMDGGVLGAGCKVPVRCRIGVARNPQCCCAARR
jgi:hypothetical protein